MKEKFSSAHEKSSSTPPTQVKFSSASQKQSNNSPFKPSTRVKPKINGVNPSQLKGPKPLPPPRVNSNHSTLVGDQAGSKTRVPILPPTSREESSSSWKLSAFRKSKSLDKQDNSPLLGKDAASKDANKDRGVFNKSLEGGSSSKPLSTVGSPHHKTEDVNKGRGIAKKDEGINEYISFSINIIVLFFCPLLSSKDSKVSAVSKKSPMAPLKGNNKTPVNALTTSTPTTTATAGSGSSVPATASSTVVPGNNNKEDVSKNPGTEDSNLKKISKLLPSFGTRGQDKNPPPSYHPPSPPSDDANPQTHSKPKTHTTRYVNLKVQAKSVDSSPNSKEQHSKAVPYKVTAIPPSEPAKTTPLAPPTTSSIATVKLRDPIVQSLATPPVTTDTKKKPSTYENVFFTRGMYSSVKL